MATKMLQPVEEELPHLERGWLTPKQLLFVDALLADKTFNATAAARAAGYGAPAVAANKLMKNERVLQLVGNAIHNRSSKLKVTAESVLMELARIGLFNPKSILDPVTGEVKDLRDMSDDTAAVIQSIKVSVRETTGPDGKTVTVTKIKDVHFWNKLEALTMLAKHVGLLKDLAPQLNLNVFNWDAFAKQIAEPVDDVIEAKIQAALPPPAVEGKEHDDDV